MTLSLPNSTPRAQNIRDDATTTIYNFSFGVLNFKLSTTLILSFHIVLFKNDSDSLKYSSLPSEYDF
jgi:hypothetical protein